MTDLALTREYVTLIADPGLPSGNAWDRAEKALDHLHREGLLDRVNTYWDESQHGIVAFNMSAFGQELFASALGIDDFIGFGDFIELDSQRLVLDPPIPPMPTLTHDSFSKVYTPGEHDQAWRRAVELA